MHFAPPTVMDVASPADILGPLILIALVVAVAYAVAAVRRGRSRRAHATVESTGHGVWAGAISDDDLYWLFPEMDTASFGRSLVRAALTGGAVPVCVELDPDGLRLRLTGRVMRHRTSNVWSAPWADIAAGTAVRAGYKTIDGKMSAVPMTDVLVTVVGKSACAFLEWWALEEAEGEEAPRTPEELAEEAQWAKEAKRDLGPAWAPGIAVLRVRMSAADGLMEAIARWARGHVPEAQN